FCMLVVMAFMNSQIELCDVNDFKEEAAHRISKSCLDRVYQSLHLSSDNTTDCTAIRKGDTEAIEQILLSNLANAKKRVPLSENDYLTMTEDCDSYKEKRKFIAFPLSNEEEQFPIAYSMVVHENIEIFERLLRAIYTPQNAYCVHVDQKAPELYQQAVKGIASCFENVFIASKLENVTYASWVRVQADLNCMEDLLRSKVQWKYLLNTCGADFPIKTNAEIVNSLKVLNGKNSLETEKTPEHKKLRWKYSHIVKENSVYRTQELKSPPPIRSPMFSGNAYFVVTREFVQHLFKDPEVQKLVEWAKDTYSPDEFLWATLQRMPGVPGSLPYDDKYQTSDMLAIARLVKWSYLEGDIAKGAPYPLCTGTHRRSTCVYGAGDLKWILQNHHLLANKFDPSVDDIAIQCLEDYLRYKSIYRDEV
uniref:Beta-1,3-galactosyl-O-glycosyl-glycoprotein beta-1,6-N-acetylglucosaminyltransferase 3 n=1 Tax=Latimeria chalumnae TaxID=7897 RepID=H3BF61_LATCH